MGTRSIQFSFSGGEITPEMFGRIDDGKYHAASQIMRNFIALPQGPAAQRPGFQFVHEVKNSATKTRLIPFIYSNTQNFVIEVGAGYFRWHTNGAVLMNGNAPYEVAHDYAEDELFDIHYVQSADVMTLVHRNHPPRELRRYGALDWRLVDVQTQANVSAPASCSCTATKASSPSNLRAYQYRVTALDSTGLEESLPSPPCAAVQNNLLQTGASNTISWTAVSGSEQYNVYCLRNGLYGYIGRAQGTSFVDDNIAPDMSTTPPNANNPFSGIGDYPGTVAYFEQRRVFSSSINAPQTVWMSRTGYENNFSMSIPTRSDDAIVFRVASREANQVRNLVPLQNLVLMTSSDEWRVSSSSGNSITPTTLMAQPNSYVGASNRQPLTVNNTILYCAARGGHVREMAYDWRVNGFVTSDLSLRATHLFNGLTIADCALSKCPDQVGWFVSSNGRLLGITYVPEQQVGGWHWHDTDGTFESVAVVPEGNEDAVYCIIRRTIGGAQKRYVERMAPRLFPTLQDAFYVDCGLTYSGAPASTFSGLGHLEGKTVSILGDGAVFPQQVVMNGTVTTDQPVSKASIGLPYTADIQTLPFAVQVDNALGIGSRKNVNRAFVRMNRSNSVKAGPSFDALKEAKMRTTESYGAPPSLQSSIVDIAVSPSWNEDGCVCVRNDQPVPLEVVSLVLDVSF